MDQKALVWCRSTSKVKIIDRSIISTDSLKKYKKRFKKLLKDHKIYRDFVSI